MRVIYNNAFARLVVVILYDSDINDMHLTETCVYMLNGNAYVNELTERIIASLGVATHVNNTGSPTHTGFFDMRTSAFVTPKASATETSIATHFNLLK